MDDCGPKIACSKHHDDTDFIIESFERQLLKNDSNKALRGLKPHTHEKLILRSRSYNALASAAFQTKEFQRAHAFLTKAISLYSSPALFAKRSILHLMMENYQLAAADGTCAIGLDHTFPSGYFCRALALIHLREYKIALRDLEMLRQCLPNSKNCSQLYVSCRNQFMERGEIEPFEAPQNINEVPVNEEVSVFVPKRIVELKAELSTSGVIEASKLTEEFVMRVIETYKRGIFHLPEKHVLMVLHHALDLLKGLDNVVSIDITAKQTLTVVGDLRGNFHNLLCIFNHNLSPQFGRPYIFNGNIIGDYRMSLPCIVIILCMKILFPEDVFINRGSEECLEECEINGFENEVLTVYDEEVMKGFSEVFNWLPVAHVLNNSVLIVHGGIFEWKNVTLANIQAMKRGYQPPSNGPMCDILHSDPWNYEGTSKAGRQKGVWFGPDAAIQFCRRNCLDYIVRSHQMPNILGYEAQSYRHCFTVNSSTQHCTYMKISGKTSVYHVLHGRKQMKIPKNCSCWIMCNCRINKDKQEQPLNDYATLKLDSLPVPSEISSQSTSVKSSGHSLFRSKSNASRGQSQITSQQGRSNKSVKSLPITSIEYSHQSLMNFLGKSTSTLVRSEFSAKSVDSMGISQQSVRTATSHRSPIPTETDQSTPEVPDSNRETTNGEPTAPRITESDTMDTYEGKVISNVEDTTLDSQDRTSSGSSVQNPSLKTNPLAARSTTRSAHWLVADQSDSPTHSVYTIAEHEEDGEDFEIEYFLE